MALSKSVDAEQLGVAVRWVAEGSAVRRLAREVNQAASQISKLVDAVRSLTQGGPRGGGGAGEPRRRARRACSTCCEQGAIEVGEHFAERRAETCPSVRGFGGELNQIWANLIDNAIDAVPASGRVDVTRGAGRQVCRRPRDRRRPGHSRRMCAIGSSIRSSPRSRRIRAPGSASTSYGVSFGTMMEASRCCPSPGAPSFR